MLGVGLDAALASRPHADRIRLRESGAARSAHVEQYFDYLRGFYPNWDRALEDELRERLELPPERQLGKLSHGMRMKAMLASVLAFRPSLLILDEPLSGLDPLVRDEIMEGVLRQADETTIVISSHELAEIEGCTTHVAFMVRGRLLFQETSEQDFGTSHCANKYFTEMIVVAVGPPPEALQETQLRRTFDFGPSELKDRSGIGSSIYNARSKASMDKLKAEGKPLPKAGGAPRFLSFLVDDVRQKLAKEYRMADDHTLFGHSGGGLFCGHTVAAQPGAFNRYICGSAPLDAGDFEVFRLEERYAQQNKDLSAKVFFGVGEREVLQRPWSLVSSTTHSAEILNARAYPSLKLYFRSFEGKEHVTVIPAILSWGMRSVWEGEFSK